MKFGMNLLLWTGELSDEMLPVLESLKEIGFDGVELPVFNTDLKYDEWGQRLDDLGLERTAVTVRGEEDNPISADAKVRAAGVDATKRVLDCCQAVGATKTSGSARWSFTSNSARRSIERASNWPSSRSTALRRIS